MGKKISQYKSHLWFLQIDSELGKKYKMYSSIFLRTSEPTEIKQKELKSFLFWGESFHFWNPNHFGDLVDPKISSAWWAQDAPLDILWRTNSSKNIYLSFGHQILQRFQMIWRNDKIAKDWPKWWVNLPDSISWSQFLYM